MALVEYDPLVHHIALGEDLDGDETNLYGFQIVGAMNKELQREATGAQDFGGNTDLLGHAQSLSRVTQDDFTGGAYARDWVMDAAMFADCKGFTSQAQAKGLISVPPVFQKAQLDPEDQDGYSDYENPIPVAMFMVAGSIYICFNNGIMRYHIDTDDLDFEQLYNDPVGLGTLIPKGKLIDAAYDSNDQMIYALYDPQEVDSLPYVARIKTDLTVPLTNPVWNGPAGTENLAARGFDIRDTGLVVAFGTHVWNGTPPKNPQVTDGDVVWTEIGRLPGRWRDSVAYSGYDYILCTDGAYKTQLVAFDGTSILPITTFPFSFEGKSICEYAGRIYVGGVGTDVNGSEYYAELYEVTGASVRLIRSFSPEANRSDGNWPHIIRTLSVFEGLLWWCDAYGNRLMAYDITSDGIFGASQLTPGDDSFDLYSVVTGRGRHWYWGHSDVGDERGIYRLYQAGDDTTGLSYDAVLYTAEFSWEPGVRKRWSEMRIHSRYVAATVSYSIDGGETYVDCVSAGTEQRGVNYFTSWNLAGIPAATTIRFRLTLPRGSNVTTFAELIAYTFTFMTLETGKLSWSFTVNVSQHVEGRDGSDGGVDVASYQAWLWAAALGRKPLLYYDVDGADYRVQLTACRENRPIIGPIVAEDGSSESYFALSLMEFGANFVDEGDPEL